MKFLALFLLFALVLSPLCFAQGGKDVNARILEVSYWAEFSSRIYNKFVESIVDGDATPSVAFNNVFTTANTAPTTITTFDYGITGQQILVIIDDANTTFDFTGTNLKGNLGVDWSPSANDTLRAAYDGTDWFCEVSTIGSSPTFDSITTGMLTYVPTAAQVIDAVGDAILANGTLTVIDPDADYTLTSVPTIADGVIGQQLAITAGNAEANTVWIQDQDILGSSNIQLLNNVASRAITGQSVVLLYFDGTDWIEYGGGGAGGADPLPVGHHFFTPTGDGSNNNVATYNLADGTNRRTYCRTTGGADTQDMDWYAEVKLPQAISSSKDITIYTRASDKDNCVVTMTVVDQGGSADATGAVVVTPTANDTWEAMTYTLTSTYTVNEVIWIKIAITSLDTADTIDFASCSIDL